MAGLEDTDAVNLWRALGVKGSHDTLLPIFHSFRNHPLLLQALAGAISRFRQAPGDFDAWRKAHPGFDPSSLSEVHEGMAHVLCHALDGLPDAPLKVLQTIAAFRMPTTYDTLVALLLGKFKLFSQETELDAALEELEDRGLLGWDRRANRYDLHPVVRGVVWNNLDQTSKRVTYESLEEHFDSLPPIRKEIRGIEDLAPAIELYNTLVGLGRYDDACGLFINRLYWPALFNLSRARLCAELLEMLFPRGIEQAEFSTANRAQAMTMLGLAYDMRGNPRMAVPVRRLSNELYRHLYDPVDLNVGMNDLASALQLIGSIREAEREARKGVALARKQTNRLLEAVGSSWLGLILATRGLADAGRSSLAEAMQMHVFMGNVRDQAVAHTFLAQGALWLADFEGAELHAQRASKLAQDLPYSRLSIRVARVCGAATMNLGQMEAALELLQSALTQARSVNFVQEELPVLVTLSELRRRQRDLKAARELLDDIWESAERGPYPLHHADALNVLAQIELDAGNRGRAIEAATKAYRLAWCDGPPFAYHWGLEAARKHLREQGASEPTDLASFDESKCEPMPQIAIDPLEKDQ
jgi:tetratricopeptide (TPR) repeat protein